jgi:hypothetical protein
VRGLISFLLAVLLAALIYIGNFSWWLDNQILEPGEFAEATVTALRLESSRDALGRLIADRLVDEFPLLVVLESNLATLFSELLASPALEEVLAFVATEIHNRIVTGGDGAIVVDLASFRDVILGPIEAVAPRLAILVPDDWFSSVEVLEEASLPDLSRQAQWVGTVKFLPIIGALLVVFLLMWHARRRGANTALIGMAFLLAGLATAVLVPGARIVALAQARDASVEVIVSNTYDQFTGYLKASALAFALVGVALVAIGISLWAASSPDRPIGAIHTSV